MVAQRGKPGRAAAFHGGGKLVGLDGFQQIIETVVFEGLDGILVVSGGEDDRRGHCRPAQHVETQAVGQADVSEYKLRGRMCL